MTLCDKYSWKCIISNTVGQSVNQSIRQFVFEIFVFVYKSARKPYDKPTFVQFGGFHGAEKLDLDLHANLYSVSILGILICIKINSFFLYHHGIHQWPPLAPCVKCYQVSVTEYNRQISRVCKDISGVITNLLDTFPLVYFGLERGSILQNMNKIWFPDVIDTQEMP